MKWLVKAGIQSALACIPGGEARNLLGAEVHRRLRLGDIGAEPYSVSQPPEVQ